MIIKLAEFLALVSDNGHIVMEMSSRHFEEGEKVSSRMMEDRVKELFAMGSSITSLFVRNAPYSDTKGMILKIDKSHEFYWKVTLDVSKCFSTKNYGFLEVKKALVHLVKTLKKYTLDDVADIKGGFRLQICNEVVKGKRDFSLNVLGLKDCETANKEISAVIRADAVLVELFMKIATRLRSIGRWSWTYITEDELYGEYKGPSFQKYRSLSDCKTKEE